MRAEQPITDAELHAAADGVLEPERQATLDAHLTQHPQDAERIAFYRRINAELHRLYDPVLAEPIPASLTRRPRWPWLRLAPARIAAALGWIVVGVAAGWLARDLAFAPTAGPDSARLASLAASVCSACSKRL